MSDLDSVSQEARDEMTNVVQRHADELSPDDLRAIASKLETIADKWEDSVI